MGVQAQWVEDKQGDMVDWESQGEYPEGMLGAQMGQEVGQWDKEYLEDQDLSEADLKDR